MELRSEDGEEGPVNAAKSRARRGQKGVEKKEGVGDLRGNRLLSTPTNLTVSHRACLKVPRLTTDDYLPGPKSTPSSKDIRDPGTRSTSASTC